MAKYECITPCWHDGSKYKKGDVATFKAGEGPRDKKGLIRHFVLIEPDPEHKKPQEHESKKDDKGK